MAYDNVRLGELRGRPVKRMPWLAPLILCTLLAGCGGATTAKTNTAQG
jgi:hypothetical protein